MQKRKEKQKEAGLKEIRVEIKLEREKLVRAFAQKLKVGAIKPGALIRVE